MSVKRVAAVLSLLLIDTCVAWTIDQKNFTESVSFELDTTNVEVPCWYPISGSYGLLPRILFYFTIVFALLASHFEWLIAGALAAALTYSGSAAIHACFLIWRGPAYGELDIFPLLAILSTSCLITIPLINWSKTLRTLGSRDGDESGARMIIIYWGALVLVGLITVLTKVWTQINDGSNFSTLNPITCSPPNSQMNYTAGQNPSWNRFTVNLEWIQENGCIDPCRQSSFLWPPNIFRSYSDLQLLSESDIRTLNSYIAEPGTINGVFKFFTAYAYFGTVVGAFVFSEGIWALCFGRKTPHQARDVVYSFIVRFRLRSHSLAPVPPTDNTSATPSRRRVAKYVATLAYFWAVIATILSALLFIVNICTMELILTYFPQSESANHIGAWSPWANTGLVLFAAFLARFHRQLVHPLRATVQRVRRSVASWAGGGGGGGRAIQQPHRRRDDRGGQQPVEDHVELELSPTGRQGSWGVLKARHVFNVASENVTSMRQDLREEWVLLKVFWRNPEDTFNNAPTTR